MHEKRWVFLHRRRWVMYPGGLLGDQGQIKGWIISGDENLSSVEVI